MGGKNVQIVMDDANLDLAVEAHSGCIRTTGQRCTATSRLIIHKDVASKMISMLVERAKALKVGNGLDESVNMGPCVNESQLNTVLGYVEIARRTVPS